MHHHQQEQDSKSRAAPLHKFANMSHLPTMLCALVVAFPSVTEALSTTSQFRAARVLSPDTLVGKPSTSGFSWTDELLEEEEDDAEEFSLSDFQGLQEGLGSEVVPTELQKQIDEAALKPDLFLEAYLEDATLIEKVAMSSLPQQLPKPAVSALSAAGQKKNKKKNQPLRTVAERVTPQEELALAREIQKGVALHKVKTDFEEKHGREITRQEWCEESGLESAKDLRKQVFAYRRSKQQLVASNMGLVHAVVRGLRNVHHYEECVQEGSLGLLRAAELFDPERGLRFSTYATIWIKGILSNSHLKEPIKLPQREKTKWNKIRYSQDTLASELGREPTRDEVSKHCGMPLEEVMLITRRMTQAQQVLSLDYEYNTQSRSGAEMRTESSLQRDKAFMSDVDLAERTQFHADVVATLANNLDAREARLMRLRYGLVDGQTRTIQECADAMGLSKTRVQQLAKSCLKKLREASDAESLQEYLLTIA